MKRLNDYIIEKQQINEAGLRDTLFGEIVMKLLGTGLDWIGKGVGWIADSLKGAAAEGWKSFSGINDDAWFGWRKRPRPFLHPRIPRRIRSCGGHRTWICKACPSREGR